MNPFRLKRNETGPQRDVLSRIAALSIIIALSLPGLRLMAQVGVHTDFPDASAAMEILSTNKGLLIPRVTLTASLLNPSPVTSPATGLLVFNNGSNQPIGFYYWNGTQWVAVAGGGGGPTDFWSLFGNAGTSIGSNFLGTTDAVHLAIRTNNVERMRLESDGQVVIGNTSPYSGEDKFTVIGDAVQRYAINAYSPHVGVYTEATYACYQGFGARYGFFALVDTVNGYGITVKNADPSGYGGQFIGSNKGGAVIPSRSFGLSSSGNEGLLGYGSVATGTGVVGVGNYLDTAYFSTQGSGGAFTGYHAIFGRSRNVSGTGVIASGNNLVPSSFGTGSGGAFTGTTTGMVAWATNSSTGVGVIGAGNNSGTVITSSGSGGAFTGYDGVFAQAINNLGIGVIGVGGNSATYAAIDGIGGAFTGYHGVYGYGANPTIGAGVVGVGNNLNVTPAIPSTGAGGAFTGNICGAYGFSTNTSSTTRYGGYFETASSYAYVGYRSGSTSRKIVGTGNPSAIIKNRAGELVLMTCPEAPEVLFMDFGIGKLEEGRAHIEIDPDLAININVSDKHPLKVFITLEGECNGVYVTNKSANGFDVIELMGGKSDIPFSWQIVATRSNEEYVLRDGTVEINDNSTRFPPGPGPLELIDTENVLSPSGNGQETNTIRSQPGRATMQRPVQVPAQRNFTGNPIQTVDFPDGR